MTTTKPVADYHDRAEWLEARKAGVGGSDAGAIVGVDPFRTAVDIYHEKVAPPGEDPEPNPDMLRGRIYEEIAVQLFVEKTGRQVRRQPMRQHKEHPYMLVNMDRQLINDPRGPGYLEVKSPGPQVFRQLKDHGLPERFILQMQHGLEVTGYSYGTYVVYDCVRPFTLEFDVERDEELGAFLVEHEGAFWQNVTNREPPSLDPIPLPHIEKVGGEVVRRDDVVWAKAIDDLREAKALTETALSLEEGARDALKRLMGTFGVFQGAGAKIHWKLYEGRKTFDKKALAAVAPIDALSLELALANYPDVLQLVREKAAELRLDLSRFEKQGEPYPKLTPYLDIEE